MALIRHRGIARTANKLVELTLGDWSAVRTSRSFRETSALRSTRRSPKRSGAAPPREIREANDGAGVHLPGPFARDLARGVRRPRVVEGEERAVALRGKRGRS